jgi:hypothetical protein
MSLDVEVPQPPELRGPRPQGEYDAVDVPEGDVSDDYRREQLADFLEQGAWADGFEEWAADASMSEKEFELVRDLGLFQAFDFYWDPSTDQAGYRAPTLPDDAVDPDREDVDANGIDNELDTLGRVVSEVLENDYLLRDDESLGFFSEEYTGGDRPDQG